LLASVSNSNSRLVGCCILGLSTSDSKRDRNRIGRHSVVAVCLLQKTIERGSQAAVVSHTYMSKPKCKIPQTILFDTHTVDFHPFFCSWFVHMRNFEVMSDVSYSKNYIYFRGSNWRGYIDFIDGKL
jgi:hypothetical protein